MGVRSFHFRMNDADPQDKRIIEWLVHNPHRSESIREALRVYFFLREHGIPVVPVPQSQAEPPTQEEGEETSTETNNSAASEFFQAMRAGVEDWI
jgi:hypothetical protein